MASENGSDHLDHPHHPYDRSFFLYDQSPCLGPHEWLSQVLIYGAYRFGGYSGLMLWLCFFTAALLIAGYALCSHLFRQCEGGFLGAMIIWFFATSRPCDTATDDRISSADHRVAAAPPGRTRNPRWFFWLPPLFAVWVNCHGSFFLGFLLAALFLLCSFFDFRMGSLVSARWDPHRRKMLMLALVFSAAALFLNPVGVKADSLPIGYPGTSARRPEYGRGVDAARNE